MQKKSTELMKKFGMKLRIERTKKSYSQDKLAELSGISQVTIGTIERGLSSPTIDTVQALAYALEISLSDIFNFNY